MGVVAELFVTAIEILSHIMKTGERVAFITHEWIRDRVEHGESKCEMDLCKREGKAEAEERTTCQKHKKEDLEIRILRSNTPKGFV